MQSYANPRRGDTKSHKTPPARPDKAPISGRQQRKDEVVEKVLKLILKAAGNRFWRGVNHKKVFTPWRRDELVTALLRQHVVHSNSELAGIEKEKVIKDSINTLVKQGHLTVTENGCYRLNDSLLAQVS